MTISSRTPEGEFHRCPLCGHETALESSYQGDALCPSCGQLLWRFRDRLGLSPGITPEMMVSSPEFTKELARDSLDFVEMVMWFEEEFDVNIPDEDAQKIHTFADAVRYIVQHRKDH
jgi:acyl carrier protein